MYPQNHWTYIGQICSTKPLNTEPIIRNITPNIFCGKKIFFFNYCKPVATFPKELSLNFAKKLHPFGTLFKISPWRSFLLYYLVNITFAKQCDLNICSIKGMNKTKCFVLFPVLTSKHWTYFQTLCTKHVFGANICIRNSFWKYTQAILYIKVQNISFQCFTKYSIILITF